MFKSIMQHFLEEVARCNLADESNWCTILFNIFIYFSSLHVSGVHHQEKITYLCDTGTCHSL